MAASPEVWTIQRLLRWTKDHFERKNIDSPRLTGELLLSHALGLTRPQLYMQFDRPLDASELDRYRVLVRRRAEGVPTQYLVGGREFYGRWFELDARSFMPRQETELLVEACLAAIPGDGAGIVALDLCAGSGCVGVPLLAERSELRRTAVARAAGPSEVALANAMALKVGDRYQLLQGDLFEPLDSNARWSLIVSNPPYVATGDIAGLQVEVRDHEPHLALDGGVDGLEVIRRIIAGSVHRLAPGGLLALEIGDEQGPGVRALLEGAGLGETAVTQDYAGNDRIALARR